MTTAVKSIDRAWILAQFTKGLDAEREMAENAAARGSSPPDSSLSVLYNEIAAADKRHVLALETIAARYGYTPSKTEGGGIGDALGRLRDRVSEIGATPLERLGHDLAIKANSLHWYHAWLVAFESLGEVESARDLRVLYDEETAHRDALQKGLDMLVERGASGAEH